MLNLSLLKYIIEPALTSTDSKSHVLSDITCSFFLTVTLLECDLGLHILNFVRMYVTNIYFISNKLNKPKKPQPIALVC